MKREYASVPATELREHASDVVNRVAFGDEQIVLTRHGKPIAAIVSLASLDALRQSENAYDVQAAAAARNDVRLHGAIPWEQVKAEIRRG